MEPCDEADAHVTCGPGLEFTLGRLQIMAGHFADEFFKAGCWFPTETGFCLRRVPQQVFHFGWSEISGVDSDNLSAVIIYTDLFNTLAMPLDFHVEFLSCKLNELPDRMLLAGCDDEIISFVLLQHHPLHFNIVPCMPPIAKGIQVSKK